MQMVPESPFPIRHVSKSGTENIAFRAVKKSSKIHTLMAFKKKPFAAIVEGLVGIYRSRRDLSRTGAVTRDADAGESQSTDTDRATSMLSRVALE